MSKIIPHLWYDDDAREARDFYSRAFREKKQANPVHLDGTPSGSVEMLEMRLFGQQFSMISAGPYFKFNPSISFLVNCESPEEVSRYWAAFSENAHIMMPLGVYPFSSLYGWLEDAFGLSWQFYCGAPQSQKIVPTLMFVGDNCGKAEEAVRFYIRIFKNSAVGEMLRYGRGESEDEEGTIKHVDFRLEGLNFAAMDSAYDHSFSFNESISFMVECGTQEEIDYYWEMLSAHPEAENCGWLKDAYGISWQIVPAALSQMMRDGDENARARLTASFLGMKKLDIDALRVAYDGQDSGSAIERRP